MKLSIVVSTQPASFSALAYKGELESNITKIADLGYDGVELAVRDPALLDRDHIKKIISEKDLHIPAIGTGQAFGEEGLSFTHQNENIRKKAIARIKAQIEFAAYFNAQVIIGLIRGQRSESVTQDETMSWFLEAIKICLDKARERNVKLAMEPINRYETNLINTVSEGLDLIDKVGVENFGLLLDTFHMNIEEPSIEESIRIAREKIFHVHIADSNRRYPGAGHLDFKQIVEVLVQVGYAGFLSAEILPIPDPDTCATKTMATMRSIFS